MTRFNLGNFALRWVFALLLVALTYNPTEYSFYHWVAANPHHLMPVKILLGLLLIVAYLVFLRATWRSIGAIGIVLTLAICATVVWMLIDFSWLEIDQTVLSWISVIIIATVLAVGISWSHFRRRWSGQIDADDVDE